MSRRSFQTLLELQNLVKRDSEAYREEFFQQLRHYEVNLEIFKLKPTDNSKAFGELVSFLSAVAPCYPDDLKDFPQQLKDLLTQKSELLDPALRQTLVRALILLRNKNMLTSTSLLELFFKLFSCPDKILREILYNHIVNDIKRINMKHKNNAVNKTLQNFMYTMLTDNNRIAQRKSLDVMIELYKKGVWNDAKTVNVISTACFSPVTKVVVAAIKFFLGMDKVDEDDDSDNEENSSQSYQQLLQSSSHNKKTNKRKAKLAKALNRVKSQSKKKNKQEYFDFSAFHLLNDPQSFAEKLFKRLKTSTERFEVRLMMMNLISRLIGIHKLFVFNFYLFMQKYLQPHQKDVTQILTYLAQACHDLVPADVLEPVLLTLANNFVSDRSANEVMAVGLNSIREICARAPLSMTETLLQDLVQYKTYKDKGVTIAARSLIQLYREINPELLHRKDRGKPGQVPNASVLQYGETRPDDFVPGTELLSMHHDLHGEEEIDQENEGWESASDDEDGSEGDWVDVQHDEEEGPDAEVVEHDNVTGEERVKRAQNLTATRILTDDDFATIRRLQLEKSLQPAIAKKHKIQSGEEALDSGLLLPARKKLKQNKEERLESVMEGRKDRGKFGIPKGKMSAYASTTNKDKEKLKNPQMMRHAARVRRKGMVSMREKQMKAKKAGKKRGGKKKNKK